MQSSPIAAGLHWCLPIAGQQVQALQSLPMRPLKVPLLKPWPCQGFNKGSAALACCRFGEWTGQLCHTDCSKLVLSARITPTAQNSTQHLRGREVAAFLAVPACIPVGLSE